MIDVNILIIEDEKAIRDMVRFAFFNSHFKLLEAENVEQANQQIGKHKVDLILLDWMLPGKNGIEFVKEIRNTPDTCDLPVIMLTAKSEEQDKIRGLTAGVDDYIVKPFSPKELLARIKAILRRTGKKLESIVSLGDIVINNDNHRVTCNGEEILLGPLEYKLLHFFMSHQDRVFSRSELLDYVWGKGIYIDERTVDVYIRRLRKTSRRYCLYQHRSSCSF